MPRPRSDIKSRIVEAARARFLVEGVDGASLRKIAQDAGTSIGMVYYYFPSKDDLLLGVVEDVYQGLLDDLAIALQPGQPVERRIEQLFARVAAMDSREFAVIRIIIREVLVSSERLAWIGDRFSRGHISMILATVGEGMQEGVIKPALPLPAVTMALGSLAVIPQIARRLLQTTDLVPEDRLPSFEQLAEAMQQVLWHGLTGPARRGD